MSGLVANCAACGREHDLSKPCPPLPSPDALAAEARHQNAGADRLNEAHARAIGLLMAAAQIGLSLAAGTASAAVNANLPAGSLERGAAEAGIDIARATLEVAIENMVRGGAPPS